MSTTDQKNHSFHIMGNPYYPIILPVCMIWSTQPSVLVEMLEGRILVLMCSRITFTRSNQSFRGKFWEYTFIELSVVFLELGIIIYDILSQEIVSRP